MKIIDTLIFKSFNYLSNEIVYTRNLYANLHI